MKKTFAIATASIFLLGALTGCSTKSTIVADSQVTVGELGGIESFNTDVASTAEAATIGRDLQKLTTATFFEQNEIGALVANEQFGSAKIVAKSPFTVAYTLTGIAKWSDGTVIDAADLMLSWLAASDPKKAGFTSQRAQSGLGKASNTPKVSSDSKTLTIVFDEAVADWQTALTLPVAAHVLVQDAFATEKLSPAAAKERLLGIAADAKVEDLKALAKAYKRGLAATNPIADSAKVTSGAYSIESFDDSGLILLANPNFTWGKATKVQRIAFKFYQDSASLLTALAAAEIDVASPQESSNLGLSDIVASLQAMKDAGVDFDTSPSSNVEQIVLNHDSKSFFNAANFADNEKKAVLLQDAFLKLVPRAKTLAAIASLVGIQESNSFVYPGTSTYYTPIVQENGSAAFRVQEAELAREEVLSTKPVGGRYSVRVLFDSDNPRAQIEFGLLDERAATVGFKLENLGVSDISKELAKGRFDVLITSAPLVSAGVSADGNLLASNLTGFVDSNVTSLLSSLAGQSDELKRAKVMQKLDTLLFAGHFGVPLYQVPVVVAHNSRISGFTVSPFGEGVVSGFNNWSVAASSAK